MSPQRCRDRGQRGPSWSDHRRSMTTGVSTAETPRERRRRTSMTRDGAPWTCRTIGALKTFRLLGTKPGEPFGQMGQILSARGRSTCTPARAR